MNRITKQQNSIQRQIKETGEQNNRTDSIQYETARKFFTFRFNKLFTIQIWDTRCSRTEQKLPNNSQESFWISLNKID